MSRKWKQNVAGGKKTRKMTLRYPIRGDVS
jgi:hypothetical protein